MKFVLDYNILLTVTLNANTLKLILCISILSITFKVANTQNLDTLTISEFEIHGLEKTRLWYVLREIRYSEGDRILLTDVEQAMIYIKSDLRKTNLFLKVDVNALFSYEEKPEVKFIIKLQENWFIYPSLIFELADRNFNVWWDEFNHSFKRVNVGVGLDHTNFTGAKDRIRAKYQFGYSTKTDLTYNRPALSANSKLGLHGGIYYSEYKEFPLFTENDKPVFIKYEYSPLYITREFAIGIQYKKNKLWNYLLNFNLHLNSIRGEYARDYPDFFLYSDSVQHYNTLYANVSYVDIDHPLKPTRGLYISWGLIKTGLGWWENYNYLSISQDIKTSKKLFNRCYLINGLFAKYAIDRKKRPYNIYKSFSYGGTNISGYEYYVINGLDYIFLNNELRYTIAKYNWKLFKIFKNEPVFRLTTEIDLSCQANAGYVNDPFYKQNNDLVNSLLYSTGLGLNFTLNDMFEFNVIYSINHLKETGFYFHTRKAF
jgi:outer membrane protein assembly factor BamA